MENLRHTGDGHIRLEYVIPTRGLIGFRGQFLTLTRGEGQMSSLFLGYRPWVGPINIPRNSAVVATDDGTATAFSIANIQERASVFIEPGTRVYEGMVIGMTQHAQEIIANIAKEKKLTNMRASTADDAMRLVPFRELSLEQALEFIREDELVEVTPGSIRMRKRVLASNQRPKGRFAEA